jgi:hypothetical protein
MHSHSHLRSVYRDLVQSQWLNGHLLGLNSLSFGDGLVTLLNIYAVRADSTKKHYAFPIADTIIESIVKYDDDVWTEIQLCDERLVDGEITYVCGYGAMGNEGFIAATNAEGLVWALFSIESNPFIRLELIGKTLKAYSDYNVYVINVENLTSIQVENYDKYN